jgi:hypothetical protein
MLPRALLYDSAPFIGDCRKDLHSTGKASMVKRKNCPFCRCLFIPNPRRKERQTTCGRQECRRNRKRQSDEKWRARHPDYFRNMYQSQKEAYGTRAEYKKKYRKENPEYVRRNAAFVRKYRVCPRKETPEPVSPTSCDLLLSVWNQTANVSITRVSHTSRDIFVTVSQSEA